MKKSFVAFMTEIVSAEQRCSNHSLLSFGICSATPVMRLLAAKPLLVDAFGEKNIKWHTFVKLEKNPTVKEFIKQNTVGHFLFAINQHVMALHNGILVDTSKKGKGQSGRLTLAFEVINADTKIELALKDYLLQHPDFVFK